MPPAQVHARATPDRPCLNCGDPTPGLYCPRCGQRKVDVRVSTWRMLREALDDQLSLNSALPRTLAVLFLSPGKLTEEYVRGRIVRYIPPFRLYLVTSLLFFVTLSAFEGSRIQIGDAEAGEGAGARISRQADGRAPVAIQFGGADTAVAGAGTAPDSAAGWLPFQVEEDDNLVVAGAKRRLLRLNRLEREEALRLVSQRFDALLSTGVFLLVPAFALLVKILYFRRRRYFVEHFVFALHVHAAAFLAVTTGVLLGQALGVDGAVETILVLLLGYLFVALRRVYHSGVPGTLARMMVLFLAYSTCLGLVVAGVFTVALLLL